MTTSQWQTKFKKKGLYFPIYNRYNRQNCLNPFLENKTMKKVSNDFVSQLLESNGWEKLGIRVDEKSEAKEEVETPEEITEESNCCPLCETDFGEMELTDEALQEHALNMMEVFSEAGLISEQVEESFIIENAEEILDVLSEAGLIVEAVDEDDE